MLQRAIKQEIGLIGRPPMSCETLCESTALSGPQFLTCKMGTIMLGSDEVVIKCLAWYQVC